MTVLISSTIFCSTSGFCFSSISMKKRLTESVSGAAITISSTHCCTLSADSSPSSCWTKSESRYADRVTLTHSKGQNLSKDQLGCEVEILIQLLRLVYHLPLDVKKVFHHILKLLPVGAKTNERTKNNVRIKPVKLRQQMWNFFTYEDLTLLSCVCRTTTQS